MSDPPVEERPAGKVEVYDRHQVDEYVAALHGQIDALNAEVLSLRTQQQESTTAHRDEIAAAELRLGRALLQAQQVADIAKADAEREGVSVIEDARRQAELILSSARDEARAIVARAVERVEAATVAWDAHFAHQLNVFDARLAELFDAFEQRHAASQLPAIVDLRSSPRSAETVYSEPPPGDRPQTGSSTAPVVTPFPWAVEPAASVLHTAGAQQPTELHEPTEAGPVHQPPPYHDPAGAAPANDARPEPDYGSVESTNELRNWLERDSDAFFEELRTALEDEHRYFPGADARPASAVQLTPLHQRVEPGQGSVALASRAADRPYDDHGSPTSRITRVETDADPAPVARATATSSNPPASAATTWFGVDVPQVPQAAPSVGTAASATETPAAVAAEAPFVLPPIPAPTPDFSTLPPPTGEPVIPLSGDEVLTTAGSGQDRAPSQGGVRGLFRR